MLATLLLLALGLRTYHLSGIFLWLDETDFFNEHIYRTPPQPLLQFAFSTKEATTNTWGWPAVIWTACRVFGGTIAVARAPSVLAGVGAVLLVFLLTYRVLPRTLSSVAAASLCAIAMPQMEFSQRTYPYAATPFMGAALILAHLNLFQILQSAEKNTRQLRGATSIYAATGCLALCIHPSLALLVAVSFGILVVAASRWWLGPQRNTIVRAFLTTAVLFAATAVINAKNPKYGYRRYLTHYYHHFSAASILALLGHCYDFGAYHLNLFYNTALYWPEALNPVLLPLVLLCVLGWVLAFRGRYGILAGHLAVFAALAATMPMILSLFGMFPFGGVRQTLFLSPFLFAFTGLGFEALWSLRRLRMLGPALAVLYCGLWAVNLPRFYHERVAVYTAEDILNVWNQSGRLPIYNRGSDRELEYMLRDHTDVAIHSMPLDTKPPYLVISTHWPPMNDSVMFRGYPDYLSSVGYRAQLLLKKPPQHLESLAYRTCLYFPPNGLWIYKVTHP